MAGTYFLMQTQAMLLLCTEVLHVLTNLLVCPSRFARVPPEVVDTS